MPPLLYQIIFYYVIVWFLDMYYTFYVLYIYNKPSPVQYVICGMCGEAEMSASLSCYLQRVLPAYLAQLPPLILYRTCCANHLHFGVTCRPRHAPTLLLWPTFSQNVVFKLSSFQVTFSKRKVLVGTSINNYVPQLSTSI